MHPPCVPPMMGDVKEYKRICDMVYCIAETGSKRPVFVLSKGIAVVAGVLQLLIVVNHVL